MSNEPCMCEIRRLANPDIPKYKCNCSGTPPEWEQSGKDPKKCLELIYTKHRLNG